MTWWRSFVAWLAALAADPVVIDSEGPRSTAAVAAAYATMRPEAPQPAPQPPDPPSTACPCGGRCVGGKYQPDGAIWQKCAPGCASCKKTTAAAPLAPLPSPALLSVECPCGGKCTASCSCGCRGVCVDGKCPKPPRKGG